MDYELQFADQVGEHFNTEDEFYDYLGHLESLKNLIGLDTSSERDAVLEELTRFEQAEYEERPFAGSSYQPTSHRHDFDDQALESLFTELVQT